MPGITYNVQYNYPQVLVQLPGRQNRLADGDFRITPGLTEMIEFVFGNQDGIPLNLIPFTIKFVVWSNKYLDSNKLSMGQSEIVLAKTLLVNDPTTGRVPMLLTDEDTLFLGHQGASGLRWSLFLINDDDEVYPIEVSRSGGRYGTVTMDLDSGIPIAELIRSA